MPTEICLIKRMVFPVLMYGFESWTIKKAERQRTDYFEPWCWRILTVPCAARRSNQSILKEISPNIHWKDWCWSWNSNTLAPRWKERSHLKRPWCWQRLSTGEMDGRRWDGWIVSLTRWPWVWQAPGVGDGQGSLACCSPWDRRVGHDWATELNRTVWQATMLPLESFSS